MLYLFRLSYLGFCAFTAASSARTTLFSSSSCFFPHFFYGIQIAGQATHTDTLFRVGKVGQLHVSYVYVHLYVVFRISYLCFVSAAFVCT